MSEVVWPTEEAIARVILDHAGVDYSKGNDLSPNGQAMQKARTIRRMFISAMTLEEMHEAEREGDERRAQYAKEFLGLITEPTPQRPGAPLMNKPNDHVHFKSDRDKPLACHRGTGWKKHTAEKSEVTCPECLTVLGRTSNVVPMPRGW